VIRFTPAGMPIVNAVLQHSSQQMEAGIARLTEFEISAVAAGEISGRFSQAPLGGVYEFTGFLAKRNRNSKSLVFHIIDFRAAPATQHLDTGA
jgi:primosomal replication protein N